MTKTKEEWQEFFDKNFPEGAHVTFVKTTESAVPTDDSIQFLTYPIVVDGLNEKGQPDIALYEQWVNRRIPYTIEHVEERHYGYALFPAREPMPVILLSNKLTEEQREALGATT